MGAVSDIEVRFCSVNKACLPHNAVVGSTTLLVDMAKPKISRFELELLEQLWKLGPVSVREIQESLPEVKRPAYTTVQTMIYRLEEKQAVRRVKKVGNAHVFEAILTKKAVYRRLIDDFLELFGGSPGPVMAHLVDSGKLSLDDVRAAEEALKRQEKKA
jgi:BlaI family transcriptional regulator, penicillinase repressor